MKKRMPAHQKSDAAPTVIERYLNARNRIKLYNSIPVGINKTYNISVRYGKI